MRNSHLPPLTDRSVTRRTLLLSGLGIAAVPAVSACGANGSGSASAPSTTSAAAPSVPSATPLRPSAGQKVVTASLEPRQVTLDLGGVTAKTWAYGDSAEGPLIRATAGDLLRVRVTNKLPATTSVHWHGIRVRNVADGVPGVTQQPIASGAGYEYDFVAPNPGTYFYHPHSGMQLDRGLYGPIIIDDPNEKGDYDAEWIVMLDDWTDGVGKGPDAILAGFKAQHGTPSPGMSGMSGMSSASASASASAGAMSSMSGMASGGMSGMGGMSSSSTSTSSMAGMGSMSGMASASASSSMSGMSSSPLGDAGDIDYPYYLINGRIPSAPRTFTGKKGQKVRIRLVNAGCDTIFRVALDGHTMIVTHTDGYPVQPRQTKALYVAMGERYDVEVTLGDGVFALVAAPEGKTGEPAMALVRTGSGTAPTASYRPAELSTSPLLGTSLVPAESAKLPSKSPDTTIDVQLNGQMQPYAWGINGKVYPNIDPVEVTQGQRVRLRMQNMTMMAHPMHIHGHTWALPGSNGLRKDTVLVLPMQTVEADLEADNPGDWMYHCHNIYHAEIGMMTRLQYRN